MRSLIPILLVLVASTTVAQEQDPPKVGGVEKTPKQDPPGVSDEEIEDTIAMVRDALEMCREAQGSGDRVEARLHVQGALEVMQELRALRDPRLLAALADIDDRAEGLGLLPAQLAAREWIVRIRQSTLPADHSLLLRAKGSLAVTRQAVGDLEGAYELFEHIHTTWERLLPPDHPNLLEAKRHLAGSLYSLGDLGGARVLQEHVLTACERLLPPDHPALLKAKSDLAVTYRDLGDLQGALELMEHVHAVWEQLLKIPCGETSTYAQLAAALGRPGAHRAVGRANGDNRLAIVVPCHRVVRSDGTLCGYGGGLWRKKWLLEHERKDRSLSLSTQTHPFPSCLPTSPARRARRASGTAHTCPSPDRRASRS